MNGGTFFASAPAIVKHALCVGLGATCTCKNAPAPRANNGDTRQSGYFVRMCVWRTRCRVLRAAPNVPLSSKQ